MTKLVPILLSIAFSHFAWASTQAEDEHFISIGGGISSPSSTTALFENPAGLVYNQSFKLHGQGESQDSNFSPLTYGSQVYLGNGGIGGGFGFLSSTKSGSNATLQAGAGFKVDALSSSLGLACHAATSGGLDLSCDNFGLIYKPESDTRVGVQVVTGGTAEFGGGFATKVNSGMTLAFDGALSSSGHGFVVKPAIGFPISMWSFALGYGIALDNSGSTLIPSGFAAGVGLAMSHSVKFEGYYNQLAKYFLGLSLSL